jgi:hypothetical protein
MRRCGDRSRSRAEAGCANSGQRWGITSCQCTLIWHEQGKARFNAVQPRKSSLAIYRSSRGALGVKAGFR